MDDISAVQKSPDQTGPEAPEGRNGSPESLTELAYQRLEEAIVRLEIAPGTVVTERQLGERIGIGRTPVREALQRLAAEGLVAVLPRRGIRIAEIDVAAQLRLLEVRREVERVVARGAAERAIPAERARFRRIADEMERSAAAGDDLAFMRLDREFNDLCLAAVRNEYAVKSMRVMQPLSRRFWFRHYPIAADMPETARLHAACARAIADGDAARAGAEMDRLLAHIVAFTSAVGR